MPPHSPGWRFNLLFVRLAVIRLKLPSLREGRTPPDGGRRDEGADQLLAGPAGTSDMLVMSCSIYCNLLRWLMASSALPPAASRPISAQNAAAAGRCSPDHFLHLRISSRLLVRSLATTHQLRANKLLLGSVGVTELLEPVTAGANPRQATSPSQPGPEPKPRPGLEPSTCDQERSGPGGLLSCCSESL